MGHAWNANLYGISFPTGRYPVKLHTNLDLATEVLPEYFVTLPRVGDLVQSETAHPNRPKFRLQLRVCSVVHTPGQVEVELHVPQWYATLSDFYHDYEQVTGRKFI